MNIDKIKIGDTVRVTTEAHEAKGFGSKVRQIPKKSLVVKVDSISTVAGQAPRKQLHCTVMITESGEDLGTTHDWARPRFSIYENFHAPQTLELVK